MANAHGKPARPGRRLRLRFSLRTLLLFVLLIASAGALWWRWEPWGFSYTINMPDGPPTTVHFSDDGRLLLIAYDEPTDRNSDSDKSTTCLDVREAASGQRRILLRHSFDKSGMVQIRGEHAYFFEFGNN